MRKSISDLSAEECLDAVGRADDPPRSDDEPINGWFTPGRLCARCLTDQASCKCRPQQRSGDGRDW